MMPDELAVAVDDREHWMRTGRVAVFAPPGSRSVHVSQTLQPTRRDELWHAVLIDAGVARQTRECYLAREAVTWAERVIPAPPAAE